MNYCDSHLHFQEFEKQSIDIPAIRTSMQSGGITKAIDVRNACDPSRISGIPGIYRAWGLFPSISADIEQGTPIEEIMQKVIMRIDSDTDCVAVGECGLDYYWNHAKPEIQMLLFTLQAELSAHTGKSLIVHCRDAHSDMRHALRDTRRGPTVIHCFSGDADDARKYLDLGCMISFAGNITYKNAQNLRDAVKIIPTERLLIETDAPYLAPVPFRGKKTMPEMIAATYACIAETRGQDLEELADSVSSNFETFFLENMISG